MATLAKAASDPHVEATGEQIQNTVTEAFADLDRIRLLAARGADSTELTEQLLGGKTAINRLRSQVGEITSERRAFVLHQHSEINRTETQRTAAALAALLLGLCGMIGGAQLFTSGISKRLSAVVNDAERLGNGQALEPRPLAHDELGELGLALIRTESLLADRAEQLVLAR